MPSVHVVVCAFPAAQGGGCVVLLSTELADELLAFGFWLLAKVGQGRLPR